MYSWTACAGQCVLRHTCSAHTVLLKVVPEQMPRHERPMERLPLLLSRSLFIHLLILQDYHFPVSLEQERLGPPVRFLLCSLSAIALVVLQTPPT